jgi:hypothetical protein
VLLKLTTIAAECGTATCPAIHLAETGSLVVQGRRAASEFRALLVLEEDEEAVEISPGLVEQAADWLRARHA